MRRLLTLVAVAVFATALNVAPVAEPTHHTSHHEVPVLVVVNDPGVEWGGRYERTGNERPVVVLNTAPGHNAHGLVWTYYHELGHAQADATGVYRDNEDYANAVANGLVPLHWPTHTEPPYEP